MFGISMIFPNFTPLKHIDAMKIYNRSDIFTLAHRFRKLRGCSFGLALRAAWIRIKERTLRTLLQQHVSVSFVYRKVNGETRPATGTTRPVMLEMNHATPHGGRDTAPHNIKYFDTAQEGWRSLRPYNLLRIIGVND